MALIMQYCQTDEICCFLIVTPMPVLSSMHVNFCLKFVSQNGVKYTQVKSHIKFVMQDNHIFTHTWNRFNFEDLFIMCLV